MTAITAYIAEVRERLKLMREVYPDIDHDDYEYTDLDKLTRALELAIKGLEKNAAETGTPYSRVSIETLTQIEQVLSNK